MAARAGGEWAWTVLYRDLSPLVLGYLRANRARDPDDLTGDVFVQLVRNLAGFEGDERAFRSWVLMIAHHRLIDERRRDARRPADPVPEVPDRSGGHVEEEALEGLGTEGIHRLLEHLSADQRDVLLLRIIGDLTVEDVARIVGKRTGAVKALQRRGLAALKRAISREGVPL